MEFQGKTCLVVDVIKSAGILNVGLSDEDVLVTRVQVVQKDAGVMMSSNVDDGQNQWSNVRARP